MNNRFAKWSGALVCAGIATSLAFGFQAASATPAPPTITAPSIPADFPENVHGETFGSGLNLEPDDFPDLVLAIGDNGVLGYVRSADIVDPDLGRGQVLQLPLDGPSERSLPARTVNLYTSDGVTVIGTYTVQS